MQRLSHIDGLRAIAVAFVLIFHLTPHLLPAGFIGVDIFFVISGYLITRQLSQKTTSTISSIFPFYIRRLRRLLPSIMVVVSVVHACAAVLYPRSTMISISTSVLSSFFGVANFYFSLTSGYFCADALLKPLLHMWSLGVEIQFYLVMPLFTSLSSRVIPRHPVIPVSLLFSVSLACAYVAPHTSAFYHLPFRAFEFMCGSMITLIPSMMQRNKAVFELFSALGLSFVFLSVTIFDESMTHPGVFTLLPCLGSSLLIYGGEHTFIGGVLSHPFIVFAGQLSYSLYLVHWPVLVLYKYEFDLQSLQTSDCIIILAVTAALALLNHFFVERMTLRLQPTKSEIPVVSAASSRRVLFFVTLVLVLNSFAVLKAFHVSRAKSDAALSPTGNALLSAKLVNEGHEIHRTENDTAKFMECGNRFSRRKVLIVGDSFAGHLVQMAHFIGIQSDIHFHIWIKYGCCPIRNTSRVQVDATTLTTRDVHSFDACEEWMMYLENALHIFTFDAIFVAGRWKVYTERTLSKLVQRHKFVRLLRPSAKGDGRQRCVQTFGTEKPSLRQERMQFESKIRETVSKLRQFSKKIAFVSDVPETGVDFLSCKKYVLRRRRKAVSMLNRTNLDGEIEKHCRGPSRQEIMRSVQYIDLLVEQLQSEGRVVALHPSKIFCDPKSSNSKYCLTVFDNFVLYKDGVHFSEYGALYLGIKLVSMEFVKRLL